MAGIGPKTKYEERFCKLLIEHMAEGYSFESFGAQAECGRSSLYEWAKVHPEFAEAKAIGEAKAIKYYEKHLKDHRYGNQAEKANMGAVIFPMKTRFHEIYGDRSKTEHSVSSSLEDILTESFNDDK